MILFLFVLELVRRVSCEVTGVRTPRNHAVAERLNRHFAKACLRQFRGSSSVTQVSKSLTFAALAAAATAGRVTPTCGQAYFPGLRPLRMPAVQRSAAVGFGNGQVLPLRHQRAGIVAPSMVNVFLSFLQSESFSRWIIGGRRATEVRRPSTRWQPVNIPISPRRLRRPR